ncbi:MAG TPA: aldolase/citrate lyase family protein [Acidimicrobiia bacterium]|jgi:4-hydroxy-2-oxoheptanedioate aldolase|nr:aldolase/citrate lyase family protein [Acidimicrobiia bacterium]
MRPNPFLDRIHNREVALGGWLSMPTSVSAEAMAANDFDYICIDMQHGLIDYSDAVPMLQALTTGTATPVVRVPENHAGHIGKALDAGAMGVIVPMVNSGAECVAAMQSARYAPEGSRSFGPGRAWPVEGADYWERANSDILCIPMVETAEAVANIDDILSVTGVAAIYVGPADLSVSLGYHPRSDEQRFLDTLDIIVAACERHGVTPGIHATTATAQDRLDRGFRMVTVTADLVALRAKLAADLELVRSGRAGGEASIY